MAVSVSASEKTALDLLRVDQVGSLLRPAALLAAFTSFENGQLSSAGLDQAKDAAIRQVVGQQEAHHLPILTDGEFRRINFQDSVANSISGFAAVVDSARLSSQRVRGAPMQRVESGTHAPGPAILYRRPVTKRLQLTHNVPLTEFTFAQALTPTPVKVTLIGPDRIFQRYAWEESLDVYPTPGEFLADLVALQRRIITELVQAGCRYIHVDAPGYTAYVDSKLLGQMRARGEDPARNMTRSIAADNALIAGFPGVTFGVHLCRGNERSMWHREGSYDAVAEELFGTLKFQRLLLEYDDERSGGFEPLRFIPRGGPVAVLGLITTKTDRLETVDQLTARIEEAARYVPIEQIAISPQCGFASGLHGNLLTEDDQWRKLDVMQETAERVWGATPTP